MKRILYLDCFSGISGDMTVGALCDLGVQPSTFEWELAKLELGDFHTHWEKGVRQSIHGVHFSIHEGATHRHEPEEGHEHHHHDEQHHDHGHAHDEEEHHEHHHHGRAYADIRKLLTESELSPFVKQHALGIFHRIALAEGRIHGVPAAEVHFHEVGALDSIADIVCACVGIEALQVEAVYVSALAEGRGWVNCAHGKFPIPAPATLEILAGIPLGQMEEPFEFITPTGAAIVAEFGESFGAMPRLSVERIGYGIGTRDLPSRPNVLRAVLGTTEVATVESGGYQTDVITCLETNLDDLTPELIGAVIERALAAGALDVFCTPVQMKKNRLATQLTILCEHGQVDAMTELLFAHTTTFGIRRAEMQRVKLERRFENVATRFGEVTVKVGSRAGKVVRASPEFDSCRALSETTGASLLDIYRAAQEAFGA